MITSLREESDLTVINEVIRRYPKHKYYDNIIHIRNYKEYRKVEEQNTLEAYNGYISRFPDAAQVPQAIEKRNHLAFLKASATNTVDALVRFLTDYPQAADYSGAIKKRNELAFAAARAKNTIESIEQFLLAYPDALESMQAKLILQDLLYRKAKEVNSLEAYNAFIKRYPDGKLFVDIFNLKTIELGKTFLAANPLLSQGVAQVRGFDNRNQSETGGVLCSLPDGGLLIAANTISDSGRSKVWAIRLDANGAMVWNKFTGERFNDFVNVAAAGSDGSVYLAGKTTNLRDTTVFEGWVIKLAADGKKLWSRSLGFPEVTALETDGSGIVAGGAYIQDSTKMRHQKLLRLNHEGAKMWERDYLSAGEVASVVKWGNTGAMAAGGRNWLFRFDTEGYLLWDYFLPETDSITALASTARGELLIAGTDSLSAWVGLTDASGKSLWRKKIDQPGYLIRKVLPTATGSFILLADNGIQTALYNLSGTGTVVSVWQVETRFATGTALVTTTSGKIVAAIISGSADANLYTLFLR